MFCLNRISAYGPGIAPFGAVAQAPANFTVETAAAGKGMVFKLNDPGNGNGIGLSCCHFI